MTGEISYDLVMEDDMAFVEGTYRVQNGDWQVFIFSRKDIQTPEAKPSRWESGITGVVINVPRVFYLNKEVVEEMLSEWLEVSEWQEVRGPDSLQIR